MKKAIRMFAFTLTVISILLSLGYILLLALSQLTSLPFEIAPSFLLADWVFLAIPILALLMDLCYFQTPKESFVSRDGYRIS